jgi:hypothetical protein
MFEKYGSRDTKSNTCSINAGCVGRSMVENEHMFDRTGVRKKVSALGKAQQWIRGLPPVALKHVMTGIEQIGALQDCG